MTKKYWKVYFFCVFILCIMIFPAVLSSYNSNQYANAFYQALSYFVMTMPAGVLSLIFYCVDSRLCTNHFQINQIYKIACFSSINKFLFVFFNASIGIPIFSTNQIILIYIATIFVPILFYGFLYRRKGKLAGLTESNSSIKASYIVGLTSVSIFVGIVMIWMFLRNLKIHGLHSSTITALYTLIFVNAFAAVIDYFLSVSRFKTNKNTT